MIPADFLAGANLDSGNFNVVVVVFNLSVVQVPSGEERKAVS
jgi:hypothetical protein